MKTKTIVEGKTKLTVPDVARPEQGAAFFNPVQKLSRDVSLCVYPKGTFLDSLAATGARGIRVAKELGLQTTLNDKNPMAIKLIRKNALLNKVKVQIEKRDANSLMNESHWDIIDVDPFGSPVPFVDAAALSVKKMLAVTATDVASICGVYPSVTFRRYQATVKRTPVMHELGLRVLAGFVVRTAAKYDVALTPVLAHSTAHYYRLYFTKREGANRTDELLKSVGMYNSLGPLFLGNLWDPKVCKTALTHAKKSGFTTATDLLALLHKESTAPAWFYNLHALASELRTNPPKMDPFLQKLRDSGYTAVRTHIDYRCFRTDAPQAVLKTLIK